MPPVKLHGNSVCGTRTNAAHCREKNPQSLRLRIYRRKEITAVFRFILRLTGPQRLGERSPEAIEACIRHLHDSANIGWFPRIEKLISFGSVAIDAAITAQEFECDQRIEKVAC
jgi:hypothetical protein